MKVNPFLKKFVPKKRKHQLDEPLDVILRKKGKIIATDDLNESNSYDINERDTGNSIITELNDVSSDDSDVQIIEPSELAQINQITDKLNETVNHFTKSWLEKRLDLDNEDSDEAEIPINLFSIDADEIPVSEGEINFPLKQNNKKAMRRFPHNPELRDMDQYKKYWEQRHILFNRFDMGIRLDKESWYSVTPEYIAIEQSQFCGENDIVFEPFCGAGGNTIQFLNKAQRVIACDIDYDKLELTKNNCQVYGVNLSKLSLAPFDVYKYLELEMKLRSENYDIFPTPNVTIACLSPPWHKPHFLDTDTSRNPPYSDILLNIKDLIKQIRQVFAKSLRYVMVYLPRNFDIHNFIQENQVDGEEVIKLEHKKVHPVKPKKDNRHIKAITVVFKKRDSHI